jgi:hypothetical protein
MRPTSKVGLNLGPGRHVRQERIHVGCRRRYVCRRLPLTGDIRGADSYEGALLSSAIDAGPVSRAKTSEKIMSMSRPRFRMLPAGLSVRGRRRHSDVRRIGCRQLGTILGRSALRAVVISEPRHALGIW